MRAKAAAGQRVAFLFGPERSGLVNDDIALAHGVITIPLNPDFSSLNLAQAVLLVAYEWSVAGDATPGEELLANDSPPAPHAEMDNLFRRLEDELEQGGFFRNPDQKPSVIRNLRSMLIRKQMTEQEVRTFHGVISTLTCRHD